ncbi:hypothetical protein GCM10022199_01540 [Marihabitans asiaticum]|uniref:DUF6603 domain-containing protein n=1 Tax=Marihabitans asiaticum TaxID=415218 RepID=A0A560WFW0_9MICO|nr:DUF6603 domain-containing protein [Marihabitans asiaticum]TWD16569.1 hypothetical protein FB557_0093 [Marihabitans asiaticum]
MTLAESDLGDLAALTRAIGLTDDTGNNAAWFTDPVGGSAENPTGLKTMLSNDDQRDALVDFVDATLGPPERHAEGEATWVPLFFSGDPNVTIYAVLTPVAGAVRLGVAAEFAHGDGEPSVSGSVHVPLFQVPREGPDTRDASGTTPRWLFLGRPGADIEISLDATFTSAAPTPGQAHLGGAGLTLLVPTAANQDVGFALNLTNLQLPGATAPANHELSIDDLTDSGELGTDLLDLVIGLLRAHLDSLDPSDPALRVVTALAGILGLRDVTGLPAPAWAEVPTRGLAVIVEWAEQILGNDPLRDTWLAELADLVEGTALPAQDAVSYSLGDADLVIGLRVTPGLGGASTLVPWVRLTRETRPGADIRVHADLLRLDTATGAAVALPSAGLEAVFGADAGGSDLIDTADLDIGSLHLGLTSREQSPPAFTLTLHDVTLTGTHHDVLDLSNPDAALDAANTVLDGALTDALSGLGDAADALLALIGINPPAGVSGTSVATLISNPLGALRGYYDEVTTTSAAAQELLGHLRDLLTDATSAIPGSGTPADPWRLPFLSTAATVDLRVWREGSTVHLAVHSDISHDITDTVRLTASAQLDALAVDLTTGSTVFGTALSANVVATPIGGPTLNVPFGSLTAHATGLGASLTWSPGAGLSIDPWHPGLSITTADDTTIPIVFPDTADPDWDAIQDTVTVLLAELGGPVVRRMMTLIGWSGTLPALSLADLVNDPAQALRTWAAELVLDCSRLATVMDAAALVLSAGSLNRALGAGSTQRPFRAPLAGQSAAPALAVWTQPGCPPRPPMRGVAGWDSILYDTATPSGHDLAAALTQAAITYPDIGDQLVARPGVAEGFDLLIARWAGTDGVIAPPATVPAGIGSTVLDGHSLAELSAAAMNGLPLGAIDPAALVVHVGCSDDWLTGRSATESIDATTGSPTPMPAGATTTRYLKLPTVAASLAQRPGVDPVQVQADLIAEAIASPTNPVTLVGHGAAGAACVRAAHGAHVAAVATVGTPWHPAVAVTGLQVGLPGNALRLLGALVETGATPGSPEWLDSSDLMRGTALIQHALSVPIAPDLPTAATEPLPAGTPVHAVFGAVDASAVAHGLAAVIGHALHTRSEEPATTALMTSLHAGIDLPVVAGDIGGITVGAGARLELLTVERAGPTASAGSTLDMQLDLGITDGWMVGGPGADSRDLEVRWAEIHVLIPLAGGPGSGYLVLHDATAFGVTRTRWLVTPEALEADASLALPEVKLLLGEVVGRVVRDAPALADLLTAAGLIRDGGLDPSAVDTLLHDPRSLVDAALATGANHVATLLRTLSTTIQPPSLPPTQVRIGLDQAYADVDLASRSLTAVVTLDEPGMPPIRVAVEASAIGATASATVGEIDPQLGGAQVVLTAGPGGPTAIVEFARGAQTPHRIELFPHPSPDAALTLVRDLAPGLALRLLAEGMRALAGARKDLVDALLTAIGLLREHGTDLLPEMVTPWGLLDAPGAWLRTLDPTTVASSALDALGELLVPSFTPGLWTFSDEIALAYVLTGDSLTLTLEADLSTTIDGHASVSTIAAGLAISRTGHLAPALGISSAVDGWGAQLQISPSVTLSALRAGGTPLPIYPAGPGLGEAVATGATAVIVLVLNRLIDERTSTDPLLSDVARAVHALTGALGLLDASDDVDSAALTTFAGDPASHLLAHLPDLVVSGIDLLAEALDPAQSVVAVTTPSPGTTRIALTTGAVGGIDLISAGPERAISFFASIDLDGHGTLTIDHVRLSGTGVHLAVSAAPILLDAGPVRLRPAVSIEAGVSSAGFSRSISAGIALDDDGDAQLRVAWALDGSAPELVALTRVGPGDLSIDTDPVLIATRALSGLLSIVTGVLAEQLQSILSAKVVAALQEVVFTDGDTTLDPTLFSDLLDPEALFTRLQRLAWNCATAAEALSIEIAGALTVGFAARPTGGGRQQIGVAVSLPAGSSLPLVTGETTLDLEVDSAWIDAPVEGGLSIYVLEGTGTSLELSPRFAVAGLGVRIGAGTGPLLTLGGLTVDAIGVHTYAEASGAGVGGGARVQIEGLAITPGGAGGNNAVASGIMEDAGAEAGENRPAFSPSLAIQKPPGHNLGVSLRAGDPPGPWWLVIQRQLGPLYLDAVGLDTAESGGQVTRITLLFNGSVSMFGLTAAVEQLSISWLGGDVLSISSWSVDLMGLAVSADLSGIMLSGGLLKTVEGEPPDQQVSYVGMLVARFATYGLSVFGGYSQGPDGTSFFIFGAVNGPIGGPPAFFLTGLGGGFGINRGLVIPSDLNDFPSFPFLQALDPGAQAPDDPMGELRRLSEYFPHEVGTFWFAAGISFTSFALVDGVAVIAVSFGNGLEINLLGLARMALPRPGAAIVSIELALLARFSTKEGVFLIQAQLTENSWLLYEDVRLTGGFAFAVWWKGPLAGQFVLTLGGYHPNFHVEGYPVVPRLGLEWRISDALVIKGGAYFALTSEALMAGVDVEVSLDWGWVWAKVAFGAHGIVYFDPFWFEVMAYARISAGLNIKLGFIRIRISISIGATITCWGPDFAGTATFEIGPCDVDVDFGSKRRIEPALVSWPEFIEKYLEAATSSTARAISAITGAGTLPSSTQGDTGAPSADGSLDLPFRVFAEFEFSITTSIPMTGFSLGEELDLISLTPTLDGSPASLGVAPMGATLSSSLLRLSVTRREGGRWVRVPNDDLTPLVLGLGDGSVGQSGSRFTRESFPLGVWGQPQSDDADNTALPSTDVVSSGTCVTLVARAQPTPTGPQINYYRVDSGRRPLPLTASARARREMLRASRRFSLVVPTTSTEALGLAADALYGAHLAPARTAVSRARFSRERVAPPLPGLLTEGLSDREGTAGDRVELDLPGQELARLPRRPYVTGVFSAGAGALMASVRTTVSDGRLARRPAPTTASVHGRLGRMLPVQLTQNSLAASVTGGTLTAVGGAGALPRTDVTGGARSQRSGPLGALAVQQMIGGLGSAAGRSPRVASSPRARADTKPSLLRSGDVVTLALPDPHLDTTQSPASLTIDGHARVVAIAGTRVALDAQVRDGQVKLPSGTTVVGLHSDPTPVSAKQAGWQLSSRVAGLSADAALAAGCTLTTAGTSARAGAGWSTAAAFLRHSRVVTTDFPIAGSSLTIAITGVTPGALDDIAFTLRGARRATQSNGALQPPVATTSGEVVMLTYALADTDGPMTVVTPMTDRMRVVGVLTSSLAATDAASVLARDGLTGVVAALSATTGPGARVTYNDPPGQRSPRARSATAASPRVMAPDAGPLPRERVISGSSGPRRGVPAGAVGIRLRRRPR